MKKHNIIDNNGDTLFSVIYENTNKDTIIILHGGPGIPMDYAEVINELKNNYQIIVFQQRGTKQSPCPSDDYSMEAYISDIECIAKFYNITKFHLWGHSWGGLYAQIYAEKHPEKLLSLFFSSPGSGTNLEWKQTEREVMDFNQSKCSKTEWLKMGINSFLGLLGSHQAYRRLFKQVLKNYNLDFGLSKPMTVNLDCVKANPINKTRAEILKYPVLKKQGNPNFKITIVYGDQDLYKSSKTLVINRYPTASIRTVSNGGHLCWLHNPPAYNAILKQHYSL